MIKFLDLFRQYIKYCRETNDRIEKRTSATIEVYVDKYNKVAEYLSDTSQSRIKAKDFNEVAAQQYWEWLNPKYSHNYAVRLLEICSVVLDFGVKNKLLEHNPIIYFKKKRLPPKDPPYLSSEQLRLFENYTSSFIQRQKACDMFVIILHTGFDYGDFKEFEEHHLRWYKGKQYIMKARNKPPHNKQVVPASPILKFLLEKYNYKINLLDNVKLNKKIKVVAEELGLAIRPTVKDGRKLFAMNKLNNEGWTIEAVSKMLGHGTSRTTEAYYAQANIELIHNEILNRG